MRRSGHAAASAAWLLLLLLLGLLWVPCSQAAFEDKQDLGGLRPPGFRPPSVFDVAWAGGGRPVHCEGKHRGALRRKVAKESLYRPFKNVRRSSRPQRVPGGVAWRRGTRVARELLQCSAPAAVANMASQTHSLRLPHRSLRRRRWCREGPAATAA